MKATIITREQAAEHLAITTGRLVGYERRGLVTIAREGDVEGYPPEQLRRLWTVVSLHRDARINLAGVEAILRLNAQLVDLHRRLDALAGALDEAIATAEEPDDAAP